MRKFTKSLLTLALLVFAVGGVNAGIQTIVKTVDYSTDPVKVDGANYYKSGYPWYWMGDNNDQPNCCGGTATAQLANGAFEINNSKAQTNNWDLQLFIADGFAIKAGYSYIIKVTMKADGDGSANLSFSSNWSASANKGINFTASDVYAEYTATIGKEDVTSKIAGNSGGHVVFQCGSFIGKVSIQKVVVIEEAPEIVSITEVEKFEAPTGTTDLKGMTGADSKQWELSYPKEVTPAGEFVAGNLDADDKSVNISSYDYLHLVVTRVDAGKKLSVRVFVSEEALSDNSKRHCLYPHPISEAGSVGNWEDPYYISTTGTYVVKISDYPLLRGLKGGNGWGGDDSNGTITISQSYLSSGEDPVAYVPTGETTVSGTEYLGDENITCFDATGLISAGQTLNAANPNALFIANDGMLTNTKNVIVSDICANLELTDGKPFKAPADFTATSATYTTIINADAQAGTLCLPFDATIPGGVEAWRLSYTSGDAAVATPVETTIPANTPVLLNGSGSATFTGASVSIDADAANVSGALTGVFAATTVPVKSYVLQYQNPKVGFFQVADDITINPFRAYLTAETPAPSLRIIFPEDGDVTGISEIEKMRNADNVTIFDLQGRKVAQPQKGLYIVNGKKVIFK